MVQFRRLRDVTEFTEIGKERPHQMLHSHIMIIITSNVLMPGLRPDLKPVVAAIGIQGRWQRSAHSSVDHSAGDRSIPQLSTS